MSTPETSETKKLNNFKFNLSLMHPFVHGNPGNAAVVYQLWDDVRITDGQLAIAEWGFRIKFKGHTYENEPGWLHIVHKYECKQDIDKTVEYLKELGELSK